MKRSRVYQLSATIAVALLVAASACTKESQPVATGDNKATDAAPSVTPTGKIITVEAYSDGAGNYFKPTEIEARRGDVVRFVLKSGVHNVHFFADSNPPSVVFPAPSEMLQLPEQTYDVTISFPVGTYYFQCDPHAALGMVGHIKVGG